MRLTCWPPYTRPSPVPKMPPNLVELVEGMTKEVLRNNPDNVYEFCANHMQKLLKMRDGPPAPQKLTLEQKIFKAQAKVRQRAEERRRRYDEQLQTERNSKDDYVELYKLPSPSEPLLLKSPMRDPHDLISDSEVNISREIPDTIINSEVLSENRGKVLVETEFIELAQDKTFKENIQISDSHHKLEPEIDVPVKDLNTLVDCNALIPASIPEINTDSIVSVQDEVNTEVEETEKDYILVDSNLFNNESKTEVNTFVVAKEDIADHKSIEDNINGNSKSVFQPSNDDDKSVHSTNSLSIPSNGNEVIIHESDVETLKLHQNTVIFEDLNVKNIANENIVNVENTDLSPSHENDANASKTTLDESENIVVEKGLEDENTKIATIHSYVPLLTDLSQETENQVKVHSVFQSTIADDSEKKSVIEVPYGGAQLSNLDAAIENSSEAISINHETKKNDTYDYHNIAKRSVGNVVEINTDDAKDNEVESIGGNILEQSSSIDSSNNNSKCKNLDTDISNIAEEVSLNEISEPNSMDLETAAITIQKVFRSFLFKSRGSTFDETINDDLGLTDDDIENKDDYEVASTTLNKERRPLGINRIDTVLQTVNEEKSLSVSTDDSSTLSSAATIIQAHVRGFLVRNKLHHNKTTSTNSLVNSDAPISLETDGDHKNKTILNIHIVPEGSNLSRDESIITSMDLSLDGSPSSSVNLHPLGYDRTERRKQLKREDAIQSVSPPSNNSGKLSEDVDSVKEVLTNDIASQQIITDDNVLTGIVPIIVTSDSKAELTVTEANIVQGSVTSNTETSAKPQVHTSDIYMDTPVVDEKNKNNVQKTTVPIDNYAKIDTDESKVVDETADLTSQAISTLEENTTHANEMSTANTKVTSSESLQRSPVPGDHNSESKIGKAIISEANAVQETITLPNVISKNENLDICNSVTGEKQKNNDSTGILSNNISSDTINATGVEILSKTPDAHTVLKPEDVISNISINFPESQETRSNLQKSNSDEMDVITPFAENDDSTKESGNEIKLEHSGELHDLALPTTVSRSDTSVVRGE